MITPEQCKAARELLRWDFGRLAVAASLTITTTIDFECHGAKTQKRTRQKLRAAFEAAGLEFAPEGDEEPLVRLKQGAS